MGVQVRGYLQKHGHLEESDVTEEPISASRRIHKKCFSESPLLTRKQLHRSDTPCSCYCFCNPGDWPWEFCQFQVLPENFLWSIYFLSLKNLSLLPEERVEIQRKLLLNIFKSCSFCAGMQPLCHWKCQNKLQLFLMTLNLRKFFHETRRVIVIPTLCLLWEGVDSIVHYLLSLNNLVSTCNNLPYRALKLKEGGEDP